jgi:hypothetical protein
MRIRQLYDYVFINSRREQSGSRPAQEPSSSQGQMAMSQDAERGGELVIPGAGFARERGIHARQAQNQGFGRYSITWT